MKKVYITASLAALIFASTTLTSCIGSFQLTKNVLSWNNQVSNKFVNEVVFFAFWILPVYEVTAIADVLILNSIEFWSGNNPLASAGSGKSVRIIDTEHGRYEIACDGKGYDIRNLLTGDNVRLDFDVAEQTWSVRTPEGNVPFMTMIDPSHVRILTPGAPTDVELTADGVAQFRSSVPGALMAAR
ncbi:MAG: DUF3332 domain-containing protein [Muribaculaceae bacterium]|nr:DUF3332 domain-containing protein [Muribaculaceae bacterium]